MPRSYKPDVPSPTGPASGQPYGQRQAQEDALAQVPLTRQDRLRQAALETPFEPVGIAAEPTAAEAARHPDTAGLPFGPGPGPEAVQVASLAGPRRDTEQLRSLARMLPLLERLASRPDSTAATRRIVRQVRRSVTEVRPGTSQVRQRAGRRPPVPVPLPQVDAMPGEERDMSIPNALPPNANPGELQA